MASTKDMQDIGIRLAARWKLVPVDYRNWELCELRETGDNARSRAAGTVGVDRWHRCGRYYSHASVDQAIYYVLDQLAKERAYGQSLELGSALAELRAIRDSLLEAARTYAEAMR